jgi:SAM-dependent methyltransferase
MGMSFGDVDVGGDLYRRYASRAHDLLAGDDQVRAAFDGWRSYVRTSHGEVFAETTLPTSDVAPDATVPERVFVDACYVDLLVTALLDALESHAEVTVTNRDPRSNTDALPVDLGTVHDHVLPPAQGRQRLAAAVTAEDLRSLDPDGLRDLYRRVVAREVRLALGEYYTPGGVADVAVAELDLAGSATVLDPGCGTGSFLSAAIDDRRAALGEDAPAETVERVTGSVYGIDLNPVAVKCSKLAYCCRLFDSLSATGVDAVSVPVFLTDALGLMRAEAVRYEGRTLDLTVDALVGNPPWVPWERLTPAVKERWRERYVDALGLQPHSGAAARLGHSNDDVSVPYVWVCIHRYLRPGGRASFVLKRDVMRGPAGAVLRGLQVGDRPLALEHVHDFAALEPFPTVGANAAVYTFATGTDAAFPVPTTVWERGADGEPGYGTGRALRDSTRQSETAIVPLDPEDHTTAWIRADAERAALGECAHDIRHGLKDDANDVFGLDREDLPRVDADLVYPYLKSRHVRPYGVTGHDRRLVPMRQAGADNEADLSRSYPRTYEYLRSHEEALRARSSSWLDDGPFYSVFGLGPYTWADYKVAWCRLGFKPAFTVVSTRTDPDLGERQVVPGDHYMFIATDHRETAHFLCALLNSAPYQRTLRDVVAEGKASLSKAVVSELHLPAWPGSRTSERLAALSMTAHDVVARFEDAGADDADLAAELDPVQARIDRLVERALTDGSFGDGD